MYELLYLVKVNVRGLVCWMNDLSIRENGGRPDMAQTGGTEQENLRQALYKLAKINGEIIKFGKSPALFLQQ